METLEQWKMRALGLRDNLVEIDEHTPSHTRPIFSPTELDKVIKWLIEVVQAERPDAIAACGHSGLIPASILSYKLRLPLIAVRKPDDVPKGDRRRLNAVLPRTHARVLLIDDLVAGGGTVADMVRVIGHELPYVTVTGVALYHEYAPSATVRLNLAAQFDPTVLRNFKIIVRYGDSHD